MWFTENAWQPMVLFGVLALLFGMIYVRRLQSRYVIVSIVCMVLVIATWLVEQSIITDRERVQDAVVGITTAFQKGEFDKTISYVSDQANDLKSLIGYAHNTIKVHDDMRVTDIEVEMTNRDSRAVSKFRVNATFSAGPYTGREPTRWEARWQIENEKWRMIDIDQIDPITGDLVFDFDDAAQLASRLYGR